MKITKTQLKQIVKEELKKLNETNGGTPIWGGGGIPYRAHPERPPRDLDVEALWVALIELLQNWTDKEHQYYKDLRQTMGWHAGEEESHGVGTFQSQDVLPTTLKESKK